MSIHQSPWNTDQLYLCGDYLVAVYSWSTDTITTLSTTTSRVVWMSFDCAIRGNFYFLETSGAVYYYNSTSGATSFLSQVPGESNARSIENVCCCGSPVLYESGMAGVQLSTDNGMTWQAYNDGMTFSSIWPMMADCSEGYLWAGGGSGGHGLWRNSICPFTPSNTPTVTPSLTSTITLTPTITITSTITGTPPTMTVSATITPTFTITSTPTTQVPPCLTLYKNSPNPCFEGTNIIYQLCNEAEVNVKIYTISGEVVVELSQQGLAGMNSIYWDTRNKTGREAASGVYIYSIETAEGSKQKQWGKMAVVK